MSSLAGNPSAVEQPPTKGYTRQSGPYTARSWKGTQEACIAAANELTGADSWEITGDGAVYTLTARFTVDPTEPPGGEIPVRQERLQWNRASVRTEASERFSAINPETIAFIRDKVDEVDESGIIEGAISDAAGADGVLLWNMLRRGIESIPLEQPVVIVTDTASLDFQWNIGFDNMGLIFNTGGMIADADLQSGWAANLPNFASPEGFMYGWRKQPPEITTIGSNKTQLVQEYEFGLWPVPLFTAA